MSLLLKKLAKEDHHSLGFLSPNYIIGGQQQPQPQHHSSQSTSNMADTTTTEGAEQQQQQQQQSDTSNSCVKQEEILKKFYSGDINLLICTCDMERSIESPTFVNLIVRFNCTNANSSSAASTTAAAASTSTQATTTTATSSSSAFDYFAYIETKSRAKSKYAYCHFFVEQSHFVKFFAQLNRYKQIESLLMNNYSQLIPINRPIVPNLSNNLLAINSKLTLENSVFLINRYI